MLWPTSLLYFMYWYKGVELPRLEVEICLSIQIIQDLYPSVWPLVENYMVKL